MLTVSKTVSDVFPEPGLIRRYTGIQCSHPLFYDIETTGLSRTSAFIYMIGASRWTGEEWQFRQWMAESPEEESRLLRSFEDFLQDSDAAIQFNGDAFDAPFIAARAGAAGLTSGLDHLPSFDLLRNLRTVGRLLMLPGLKQIHFEGFLCGENRKSVDGRAGITLYHRYCRNPSPALAGILLMHNEEDILGLGRIFCLLSYRQLFTGDWEPVSCSLRHDGSSAPSSGLHGEWLHFTLRLLDTLPRELSVRYSDFLLTACGHCVEADILLKDGKLRVYHPDYKNYDYLPEEDTAIPKALSAFIERGRKKTAVPETCYTWFRISSAFFQDQHSQRRYLKAALPVLLGRSNPKAQ